MQGLLTGIASLAVVWRRERRRGQVVEARWLSHLARLRALSETLRVTDDRARPSPFAPTPGALEAA